MSEPHKCSSCGAALPTDAPSGLCAACAAAGLPPLGETITDLGATKTKSLSFSLTEKPGDHIGRYKLLEQIGEGGCGVVYVAEQEQPVRRRVALKVIKLGMDTRQVVARFEAERQALALMDHPNIAKVLDAGATEAGRPFFVMELVKGVRITNYCDGNSLSTAERLGLFVQICQAIQHAHQKGIIHRDIKPSNILVTLHDGVPAPKVIDFGIAKATGGQRLTDKTIYTAIEQFIGTPAYMSPEQAEMSGLDIDTRSDIYALGVLLYELLTGNTPFDAGRLFDAGLDEIRRIIREEDPPRPSTRISTLDAGELTTVAKHRNAEPPKLLGLIRGDLDWIAMKCLEKDRNRRYETANAVAMDVQRFLSNQTVAARPPSALYSLRKMARRNKLAFTAGAFIAVALVVGIGATSSAWLYARSASAREKAARRQAEMNEQKASAEARRADQNAAAEAAQKQRAEAALAEARSTLATADFLQATRLISEQVDSDALAYLQRSLSIAPSNNPALTRLVTLLSYRAWVWPLLTLHTNGVNSAQFSLDGTRIVTASGDLAQVWDAQSGAALTQPLKHNGAVSSARFSPDGQRIVTASLDGTARVWDALSGTTLTELLKNGGAVSSAQFSPDGRRIVTASWDNTARVWDARSGAALTQPLKHNGIVSSAQFSPDGRRIVTASNDGTARVWDAQSGAALTEPLKLDGFVRSAQFSPDGQRIVTAAGDTAQVWDAQSGAALGQPLKHTDLVFSAQFSPDGRRIVTASLDGAARVWDAQSGAALTEPLEHHAGVRSAQFSPDGQRIVTASLDGTARVWDAQSGAALTQPLQQNGELWSAQFSPDGRRIVTASLEGAARVWDTQSGTALAQPLMHNGVVNSAQFSPDGTRIVTASEDRTARVWDAQNGAALARPLQHKGSVRSAQFSPDGSRIVTASEDRTARVWDAHSGAAMTKPLEHDGDVRSAQFSRDGSRIVTASGDGTARVWDAHSGAALTKPLEHNGDVRSAQFSPDGSWIVTASVDGTVQVWDAHNGTALSQPLKHNGEMISAQFSPDGRRIVTASVDGTARIWDAQSGAALTEPLKHNGVVNSAQFSPDGTRIVTASGDRTARIWDAQSGAALTQPLKHNSGVSSARFSPDGARIITASLDGTARVWDAQSGAALTEPLKHTGVVNSAQFSPDGTRIVTTSGDNTARLWDIAPVQEIPPNWLLMLAEALSGQRPGAGGLFEASTMDPRRTLDDIRQQLARGSENDHWVVWGRWFLADPATRTISPFSKLAIPEYIAHRLKDNTLESLAEAEQLAYANEPWLQRISTARTELERRTRALAVADQQTTNALAFAAQGRLAEAESLLRQRLAGLGAALPASDTALAAAQADLTKNLLDQEKFLEAETPAHQCLATCEQNLPGDWPVFNAKTLLGRSLLGQKRYAEAEPLLVSGYQGLKELEWALPSEAKPRLAEAFQALAKLYQETGQATKAAALKNQRQAEADAGYQRDAAALRSGAEQGDVHALNKLAWLLAVCDSAVIRDGTKAVGYAEKAVAATNRKDDRCLDTLAAAYAEAGHFDKAVSAQKEALALAGSGPYAAEYSERLKLYQSGKPYHAPPD
ncbi:putative Histone acetyltransferase [Verrucomicrobia bacterium]|nr:putative Histone acetyltransferase [Verrucomicrobiota bacterium]